MASQRLSVWTVLLMCVTVSQTLIAYDCAGPSINTTVISLRSVKPCDKDNSSYVEEKVRVQIIQKDQVKYHHVRTCLVEITRLIFHCGMHSHSSIVNNGISTYVTALGATECNNVHRYKTLKIYNAHMGNILMNGTTSASFVIHGSLSADGTCRGISYSENGYHWDDVTVTASVKISTRDYFATVKLDTNEISLLGGLTCPFLNTYCMDSTFGESTWDLDLSLSCDKEMTILYEGLALLVADRISNEKYIVVEDEDKIFALSLIKTTHLCGREVWQTEHPQLQMLEMKKEAPLLMKTNQHPGNVKLLTYVNSKFLYMEQSFKRSLNEMYVDALYRRCELQREILKNRLIMARMSPLSIGWLLKDQIGYVGHVLGEVIYLMQCIPRPVTIRRTEFCYNELPITIDGKPKFMSPMTHILQNHATEIDCNSITPPLFFINNEWIGLTPNPINRHSPEELEPKYENKLHFRPIQPLGEGGIYTQEEIERSQRAMVFGIERKAVENIIARRMSGMSTDNQGYDALRLFDAQDLKKMARNSLQYLWGWFTDFGMIMSGLFGIYLIIRTIKYLLEVSFNGWQIYKTMGCGLAILASVWSTLASCVLHRHHSKTVKAQKEDILERGESVTEQPRTSNDVGSCPKPPKKFPLRVIPNSSAPPQKQTKVYPDVPKLHWTDNNSADPRERL